MHWLSKHIVNFKCSNLGLLLEILYSSNNCNPIFIFLGHIELVLQQSFISAKQRHRCNARAVQRVALTDTSNRNARSLDGAF